MAAKRPCIRRRRVLVVGDRGGALIAAARDRVALSERKNVNVATAKLGDLELVAVAECSAAPGAAGVVFVYTDASSLQAIVERHWPAARAALERRRVAVTLLALGCSDDTGVAQQFAARHQLMVSSVWWQGTSAARDFFEALGCWLRN